MSILIKGMDMPKSCYDCKLGNNEYTACVLVEFWNDVDNGYVGAYADKKERAPWCPLVEVPAPHGRLIDADDIENITVIMNENGSGFNRIVAPTIIEAEVEE